MALFPQIWVLQVWGGKGQEFAVSINSLSGVDVARPVVMGPYFQMHFSRVCILSCSQVGAPGIFIP